MTKAPRRRTALLWQGLLIAALVSCSGWWLDAAIGAAAAPAPSAARDSTPAAAARPAPTSFYANFEGTAFVDQDGRKLSLAGLAGKVALFDFVYTGCSATCPLQTQGLAELQRRLPAALRRQVQLVSVSLDPLHDTPATLKDYARRMGADLDGWTFATGRPEDIDRLGARLRLLGRSQQLADHASVLWLVDASGRLVQRYTARPPDVQRLVRELLQLEQLAASGKAAV